MRAIFFISCCSYVPFTTCSRPNLRDSKSILCQVSPIVSIVLIDRDTNEVIPVSNAVDGSISFQLPLGDAEVHTL